jgi:hypothetical protein
VWRTVAGETLAIMAVRHDPFSESFNSKVSLLRGFVSTHTGNIALYVSRNN